jgi:hypothetical protein
MRMRQIPPLEVFWRWKDLYAFHSAALGEREFQREVVMRRTPPNPWDTGAPLCVGSVLSWASFSLVCALPSAASAEAFASLFGSFIGSMAQSDPSKTYMSG